MGTDFAKKSLRALGSLEIQKRDDVARAYPKEARRAERYALGMTEKKAASAKPKAETAGTPEHRPYTGCGDPRRWQHRRRNR